MSKPEDVNPYQAPAGLFSSSQPSYFSSQAEAGVTPKVVEMLAKTQPWVRFLSIMGFIGFAVLLLMAVGMLMLAVSGSSPGGMVLAFLYVLFGALYLIPSVFLSRFASDIARLRMTLRMEDLEEALQSQKSFWKFAGIATLLLIVLYVLMIALVVVSGTSFFVSSSRSPF